MENWLYFLKFKTIDRSAFSKRLFLFVFLTLALLYSLNIILYFFSFDIFLTLYDFLEDLTWVMITDLELDLIWVPEAILIALFGTILLWFLAVFIPWLREVLGLMLTPYRFSFKPEDCLNNIDFQGKIVREDEWISITSSGSGMLFKHYYWRDFEAKFVFKFIGEKGGEPLKQDHEETMLGNKYITKNNYLDFIFRARDLDNYFMLSIGVKVFQERAGKIVSKDNLLGRQVLLITPHVRVGGAWDVFTSSTFSIKKLVVFGENRLIIRVEKNTLNLWIEKPSKRESQEDQKLKREEKPLFTWQFPTHYLINWEKEKKEDSPGDSSVIPFRNSIGRIGFREYSNEHVIVKDIIITKLY